MMSSSHLEHANSSYSSSKMGSSTERGSILAWLTRVDYNSNAALVQSKSNDLLDPSYLLVKKEENSCTSSLRSSSESISTLTGLNPDELLTDMSTGSLPFGVAAPLTTTNLRMVTEVACQLPGSPKPEDEECIYQYLYEHTQSIVLEALEYEVEWDAWGTSLFLAYRRASLPSRRALNALWST
jgi:hypothetical protein